MLFGFEFGLGLILAWVAVAAIVGLGAIVAGLREISKIERG